MEHGDVKLVLYCGIDNGLNGGIVVINKNENIVVKYVMPTFKIDSKKKYDIKSIVDIFKNNIRKKDFVMLEKAHPRPISGKRACFTNGYGFGMMETILIVLNLNYEIITPQRWMKEFNINSKEGKGSIEFCKKKWSDVDWRATKRCTNAHDGETDAAVLALYGKRNK